MGFFLRLEYTKMDRVPIGAINRGAESSSTSTYAFKAGGVGRKSTNVPGILRHCGFSNVGPAVVRSDMIDVVNMGDGPPASHVEKCETVSAVDFAVDPDADVSGVFDAASNFPRFGATLSQYSPGENSRFGVVVQNLAQALCS
jgi:hypothetical protein